MDTVFIRGLKAKATIGAFDWERQIRQSLVIDLDLHADAAAAAASDDLADAVDYKAVAQAVVAAVEASSHHLVETLAEEIATLVREQFAISWLRITISKPYAVRTAETVGVTIERGTP